MASGPVDWTNINCLLFYLQFFVSRMVNYHHWSNQSGFLQPLIDQSSVISKACCWFQPNYDSMTLHQSQSSALNQATWTNFNLHDYVLLNPRIKAMRTTQDHSDSILLLHIDKQTGKWLFLPEVYEIITHWLWPKKGSTNLQGPSDLDTLTADPKKTD